MSTKFDKATAARLECSEGADKKFYWDRSLPGFGLCVRSSGRRAWVAQYRNAEGRSRRITIGDARIVSLDDARKKAREHLSKASLGQDPQAERSATRHAVRVKAVIDEYLEQSKPKHRPRYHLEVRRHLLDHAKPLHGETARNVSRAEIYELLKTIASKNGVMAANRLRAALSSLWTWALRAGRIEGDNPVAYVQKPGKERARDRVLDPRELSLIWSCTQRNHDHDRIVRLLLLTGARREEVGAMRWSEIEYLEGGTAIWTLPRERSKNGLPHEVVLSSLALMQLPTKREDTDLIFGRTENGFSGWSRCKRELEERMRSTRERISGPRKKNQITRLAKGWVLHDFRRTLSTWCNESGIEPHVVEALLNHVSGSAKRGVAGVYNRAAYRSQKEMALSKWETHIRHLSEGLSCHGTSTLKDISFPRSSKESGPVG